MKAVRRSLVGASVAALVLSTGAVMAPAPAATEGRIWVSILPNGTVELQADSSIAPFGAAEELIISAQGRLVLIEMRDDGSPSGQGRALLADGNTLASRWCAFTNVRGSARVTCDYEGPPGAPYLGIPQVRVDFGALTGATTVAMAEGRNVPLVFNGGAGPDEVYGAAGDDYLLGNGGDDRLFGGPGDDYLDGGPGDDYLEGEGGRDDMRGGPGSNSLEAADGIADIRVDCGGLPKFLDFDKDLDKPTNCGANPTPIPPAPIEPVDPPAPGQGDGTVDGVPTVVEVTPTGDDNKQTTIASPQNQIFMNTGLWFGTPNTPPVPTFPPLESSFPVWMSGLFPGSTLDLSIWSTPPPFDPRSVAPAASRSNAISTTSIRVNAQGVAEGNVPVPASQQPGNFTLQANAVTASGAAATINVGVALTQATPEPDPGPDESIAISSATRGKGKKAATITVTGATTGLVGTGITPRYRLQGAKSWTTGRPVTVTDSGTFTWRLVTPKKVRIVMVSGAIKSEGVQVAAVRR
jgi:hypothetical protein